MVSAHIPLLIEPEQLQDILGQTNVLLIDLCRPQQYAQAHIPGAVHLPYMQLMSGQMPAPGHLPAESVIEQALGACGLTPDTHVIAYDDEGGGWAGRLIWTLDVIGHTRYSYLNGGLHAWAQAKLALENTPNHPSPSQPEVHYQSGPIATKDSILARLGQPDFVIWDARTPQEYLGLQPGATRNGHIPGAINYEWTRAMDPHNGMRIRPLDTLRHELAELGISADKTIVTHCQSHHRSAFTYLLGKILGFPNIQAYPGSWSEWGNASDTPIVTG